jgi:hypothetical protein
MEFGVVCFGMSVFSEFLAFRREDGAAAFKHMTSSIAISRSVINPGK